MDVRLLPKQMVASSILAGSALVFRCGATRLPGESFPVPGTAATSSGAGAYRPQGGGAPVLPHVGRATCHLLAESGAEDETGGQRHRQHDQQNRQDFYEYDDHRVTFPSTGRIAMGEFLASQISEPDMLSRYVLM